MTAPVTSTSFSFKAARRLICRPTRVTGESIYTCSKLLQLGVDKAKSRLPRRGRDMGKVCNKRHLRFSLGCTAAAAPGAASPEPLKDQ